MDWITDTIAIGNYLEARDMDLLRRHAFQSLLSLDGTLAAEQAKGLGLSEIASAIAARRDTCVTRALVDLLERLGA